MTVAVVPGLGGAIIAELGERAVVCDLYDEVGAQVYDQLAAGNHLEVRELLRAVRRLPGPVLELAAGSGRLTFPLLALGREVVALELSPSMLELLEQRLASAVPQARARCSLVQADMSQFALEREFAAVVLGTSSISLLDRAGRQGLFGCVREHLAPQGRFLLTTVDVAPAATAQEDDYELEVRTPDGRLLRIIEHWSEGQDARTVTIVPAQLAGDDPVTVCTSRIRVLPSAQLVEELAQAGLRVCDTVPITSGQQRHADVLLEVEAVR